MSDIKRVAIKCEGVYLEVLCDARKGFVFCVPKEGSRKHFISFWSHQEKYVLSSSTKMK